MIHLPKIEIESKPQSPFIDRETILKTFGISQSTLRRWMLEEGLKYYKVSRRVFFRTKDLESWIEKFTVENDNE